MASFRKFAAPLACVTTVLGAAILWPVYIAQATERKLAGALQEVRLRAEHGDAEAQYRLGYSYRRGAGVKQDYAEAVRWFRKAADQGNARAQFYAGFLYHAGHGIARDDAESARWYRKAADQGYAYAQANLGLMYSYGQGVPRDETEAARWYRQAADQGDPYAQYLLGLEYVGGQGVPRDYAEAVRWLRQAADHGDARARDLVGIMYEKGLGVPRSYAEASRWFALGALSSLGWGVSLERALLIAGALLGIVILFVPKRIWARAQWLYSALFSAFFATLLSQHLLHSGFTFALLVRGQLTTLYKGRGNLLLDVVLAALAVVCAVGAVMEATRETKPAIDKGSPPNPPEGPAVDLA